ncbi:MAG: hypothetical protein ABI637_00530 [Gemmatimonadota bacterium]
MTGAPTVVAASRRSGDGDNTVVDPPEVRRIVLAQGIQFTRQDIFDFIEATRGDSELTPEKREVLIHRHQAELFPEGLAERIPGLFGYELGGKQYAMYLNPTQNVLYLIEEVEDKESFRRALETENTIVVYNGHARYGRGPCFGLPGALPGDDWEDGSESGSRGLFRMGYPYVGIPVHDILEHGYRANPLPGYASPPAARDSDPEMRPYLGALRRRRVCELHPDPKMVEALAGQIGGTPLGDELYWTFFTAGKQGRECHIVLQAGWRDTTTAPADLDATDLRCRMFCHFGCSSFSHNYRIVRMLKGWQRSGDRRLAYWTSDVAQNTASIWLYHLLTYPALQAGQSWEPLAAYAMRQTNRELRATGCTWQLI